MFVDIAVITSTKGLGGELKIKNFSDAEVFKIGSTLTLSPSTQKHKQLTLEKINTTKATFIIKFKEVNNIDEALNLKGCFLKIDIKEMPQGYYSRSALIGFQVISTTGQYLGKVYAIEESIAHDIFVMRNDNDNEVRFAGVKEVVKEINMDDKKIIVDLPRGTI